MLLMKIKLSANLTTRELITLLSALGEEQMDKEVMINHTQQHYLTYVYGVSTQDSGDGKGTLYTCIDTIHGF